MIDSLVRDGNKIIFATSFGFGDAMFAAAKKYPNVKFEHATGLQEREELRHVLRCRRGRDLPVRHGGRRSHEDRHDRLRRPVPDPGGDPARERIRARRPGHASGRKVKLVWTKSWFDPAKEKKAAESLVAAGADVIGQNVDSPAAGQYAQSKGLPWVGYDSNAKKFAPTSWLTAAVYNWGPYYLKQVRRP